jgi:RNA polymerase sigma factor (TIGR02999 family)
MSCQSGDARKRIYDDIVSRLYQDLRRRARLQLNRERADSFQPTILVHEAYERMLEYHMAFENREHFLNAAATAMRRILIERARRLNSAKRGNRQVNASLDEGSTAASQLAHDPSLLLDIDRALTNLRPDQVQLVELRFFVGYTIEETAEIMGLRRETAKKRWEVIKTLLYDKLSNAVRGT